MNASSNDSDANVKRLALAGKMVEAIVLYRQIHRVGLKDAKEAVEKLAGLPQSPDKVGCIPLSPGTRQRLEVLFPPAEWAGAARLLVEECGDNLPFQEKATELSLERIRFAALKLSGGDLPRLRQAIQLAKTDWRDLLVAAEFGNDVRAHETWFPKMK